MHYQRLCITEWRKELAGLTMWGGHSKAGCCRGKGRQSCTRSWSAVWWWSCSHHWTHSSPHPCHITKHTVINTINCEWNMGVALFLKKYIKKQFLSFVSFLYTVSHWVMIENWYQSLSFFIIGPWLYKVKFDISTCWFLNDAMFIN